MAEVMRTGGGAFDPCEENVYFIASNVERMKYGAPYHDHILLAVNEVNTEEDYGWLDTWMSQGRKVFIDSGIYHLSTSHARAHDISMDEALSLAPDEIDGFDELWNKYIAMMRRFEDRCWGYIELDQGGRENKIKTRAKIEALGLCPIPVYHPFNDGWDYFDYLAERYDRICFGNVVQADSATRKRLIATAWERHRKYPHLWIHLLGYTPNHGLYGFPINSGDSSAWLSSVRWSGYKEQANGAAFGDMPRHFQYQLGSSPDSPIGSRRATSMSAYGAHMMTQNWRRYVRDLEDLGCTIYPEP